MKILVAVKRVVDPYVKIRVKSDNTGIETQNIKMAMNPFDEIAVEEALRLCEKNLAKEVVAVAVGNESFKETLRHALALGAHRAILVQTQTVLESLNIAKIIKKIIEVEKPNLVLLGKQSIDGDNNQTAQMVSALLGWPQATYTSQLQVEDNSVIATREIDGGLETLQLALPAIVSVDLRLNEPRYASLPNIMQSKRKPLDVIELQHLDLNLKPHSEVLKIASPLIRSGGVKVDSVLTLMDKLQHEAKVL